MIAQISANGASALALASPQNKATVFSISPRPRTTLYFSFLGAISMESDDSFEAYENHVIAGGRLYAKDNAAAHARSSEGLLDAFLSKTPSIRDLLVKSKRCTHVASIQNLVGRMRVSDGDSRVVLDVPPTLSDEGPICRSFAALYGVDDEIPRFLYSGQPQMQVYPGTPPVIYSSLLSGDDDAVLGLVGTDLSLSICSQIELEAATLERLCAVLVPSGYGDFAAEATVVDATVRQSLEADASKLSNAMLVNASGISVAAREALRASQTLGRAVTAVPDKLVVYGVGGHFDAHIDTPCDGLVATMVILFAYVHTGGELTLYGEDGDEHCYGNASLVLGTTDKRCDTRFTHKIRCKSYGKPVTIEEHPYTCTGLLPPRGAARVLVFYGDTPHRVDPVQSGVRVAMTYKLMNAEGPTDAQTALRSVNASSSAYASAASVPYAPPERVAAALSAEQRREDRIRQQAAMVPQADVAWPHEVNCAADIVPHLADIQQLLHLSNGHALLLFARKYTVRDVTRLAFTGDDLLLWNRVHLLSELLPLEIVPVSVAASFSKVVRLPPACCLFNQAFFQVSPRALMHVS